MLWLGSYFRKLYLVILSLHQRWVGPQIIYIYIYIFWWEGMGGVVRKSLCVECCTQCMVVEVTLTVDPLPITPHYWRQNKPQTLFTHSAVTLLQDSWPQPSMFYIHKHLSMTAAPGLSWNRVHTEPDGCHVTLQETLLL